MTTWGRGDGRQVVVPWVCRGAPNSSTTLPRFALVVADHQREAGASAPGPGCPLRPTNCPPDGRGAMRTPYTTARASAFGATPGPLAPFRHLIAGTLIVPLQPRLS